jgi:hypothetical protein
VTKINLVRVVGFEDFMGPTIATCPYFANEKYMNFPKNFDILKNRF